MNLSEELLKQEKDLQFSSFNHQVALNLAKILMERIEKEKLVVAFDISKINQQIFYYASEGIVPDKDRWIKRKRNIVLNFGNSSYFMAEKMQNDQSLIASKYGLDLSEYAAVAGSFPIVVKGVGMVGAFTLTGLKPEEDHQLVIDTITTYLASIK